MYMYYDKCTQTTHTYCTCIEILLSLCIVKVFLLNELQCPQKQTA